MSEGIKMVIVLFLLLLCCFSFYRWGRKVNIDKTIEKKIGIETWAESRAWLKKNGWELTYHADWLGEEVKIEVMRRNDATIRIEIKASGDYEAIKKLIDKVKKFQREHGYE